MNNWQKDELNEFSDSEIKKKFFTALEYFFKNDSFLLIHGKNKYGDEMERGANERSVAHKLAEYLQDQFCEWNVDCEYNRHELNRKIQEESGVFPDIIVHHRGIKDNLLVIELKTSTISESKDLDKLEKFTERGDFEYQLGLFIRLCEKDEPKILWYKNGGLEKRK